MTSAHAIVGVACCRKSIGNSVGHVIFEQYLDAFDGCPLLPVAIPARGARFDTISWASAVIERLDGLILPGSRSNVSPVRYGEPANADMLLDEERDATTLPLIQAAISAEMPILAICRGFQELNVALGGTLRSDVCEAAGSIPHAAPADVPRPARYEPRHHLSLADDGYLRRRAIDQGLDLSALKVNSLHRQRIGILADMLRVEAWAHDGVIEAASSRSGRGFVLALQWHPEWRRSPQGFDELLLRDFAIACDAYRRNREGVDRSREWAPRPAASTQRRRVALPGSEGG